MHLGVFDTLPKLSKKHAFKILKTPLSKLELSSDYYKAVFHLAKYPSSDTEKVLLDFLRSSSNEKCVLIAKRKAIEVLGRMRSKKAIDEIILNLHSKDPYTIENCAWSLQQIGCDDQGIHRLLSGLLNDPDQNQRVIIQSLAKMRAISELPKIKEIFLREDTSPSVKGASIAALSVLDDKFNDLKLLPKFLELPNQNDRQCAIQDIIDSKSYCFLDLIIQTPVSPFFKFRAIELLYSNYKIDSLEYNLIEKLDRLIFDDPRDIKQIRSYTSLQSSDFLFQELFSTDFAHSYLALKTLIENPPNDIFRIINLKLSKLKQDYGALYFVVILLRYLDLDHSNYIAESLSLIEHCLDRSWPDYMKFKPQAILTAAYNHTSFFEANFDTWIDESKTQYWVSRYSAMLGIEKVLTKNNSKLFGQGLLALDNDSNLFVRKKSTILLEKFNLLD